nr:hypothetical protein [uncultured Campylobacter sp.]
MISLKSEKNSISIMANHKLQVAAKNIKYITELLQAQSAIMQKYKRRSLFNNDALLVCVPSKRSLRYFSKRNQD